MPIGALLQPSPIATRYGLVRVDKKISLGTTAYLNGTHGAASLVVFAEHFLMAFTPNCVIGDIETWIKARASGRGHHVSCRDRGTIPNFRGALRWGNRYDCARSSISANSLGPIRRLARVCPRPARLSRYVASIASQRDAFSIRFAALHHSTGALVLILSLSNHRWSQQGQAEREAGNDRVRGFALSMEYAA